MRSNKTVGDDHYIRFFREAIQNPPAGNLVTFSPEEVQARAEALLKELETRGQRDLHVNFVSCWHENKTESEALWRLYCPPHPQESRYARRTPI